MKSNATIAATVVAILLAALFLPDRHQELPRGDGARPGTVNQSGAEDHGNARIRANAAIRGSVADPADVADPANAANPAQAAIRPVAAASNPPLAGSKAGSGWSPIGSADAQGLSRDDDVIERLPAVNRNEGLREAAAGRASAMPPATALAHAERYLDALRRTGDPSLAGRAQRLLEIPALRQDPIAMLVKADLLQHVHRFDQADGLLNEVRQRIPDNRQAWLLSANIARIQGRIGDARDACERAARIRHDAWTTVCLADLDMLAGTAGAYERLQAWLAGNADRQFMNDPLLSAWLGDLAAFAGDRQNAERHLKRALLLGAPAFATDRYARLLIDLDRADAAVALLDWWRARTPELSDTLLLDLAVAANRAGDSERARLLQEQFKARANVPPLGDSPRHWRELVRYEFDFGQDPRLALDHAQANWQTQKEPIDAMLLDQAAQAAGDAPLRIALRDELSGRGMSGLAAQLPAMGADR